MTLNGEDDRKNRNINNALDYRAFYYYNHHDTAMPKTTELKGNYAHGAR